MTRSNSSDSEKSKTTDLARTLRDTADKFRTSQVEAITAKEAAALLAYMDSIEASMSNQSAGSGSARHDYDQGALTSGMLKLMEIVAISAANTQNQY